MVSLESFRTVQPHIFVCGHDRLVIQFVTVLSSRLKLVSIV